MPILAVDSGTAGDASSPAGVSSLSGQIEVSEAEAGTSHQLQDQHLDSFPTGTCCLALTAVSGWGLGCGILFWGHSWRWNQGQL